MTIDDEKCFWCGGSGGRKVGFEGHDATWCPRYRRPPFPDILIVRDGEAYFIDFETRTDLLNFDPQVKAYANMAGLVFDPKTGTGRMMTPAEHAVECAANMKLSDVMSIHDQLELADEIKRLIDEGNDVSVKDGIATGIPNSGSKW